jgi:hypothetical protein
MPAFTFEKIAPPAHHSQPSPTPPSPTPPKQRGIIIQILDRFVEARVKKSLRDERHGVARRKTKSSE